MITLGSNSENNGMCTGTLALWNQNNCPTIKKRKNCLGCRLIGSDTMQPSFKHEKQPYSIILPPLTFYSWNYMLRQVAFFRHLPNLDLSVRLPDTEVWFITPEYMFILLQSLMALNFISLILMFDIVHGDLRVLCSCSDIKNNV